MPIKTGYWIQVVNGTVQQVWDYRPPQEKIDAEGGWQEAVEVKPEITPNREYITTHSFDLTKTPPEIVWGKATLTLDERKSGLKALVKMSFDRVVKEEVAKEIDELLDTHYNPEVVEAARQAYMSRLEQINAITTHEELDALNQALGQ